MAQQVPEEKPILCASNTRSPHVTLEGQVHLDLRRKYGILLATIGSKQQTVYWFLSPIWKIPIQETANGHIDST